MDESRVTSWRLRILFLGMCIISLKYLTSVEHFPITTTLPEFDIPIDETLELKPISILKQDPLACPTLDLKEAQKQEILKVCPESLRDIDTTKYIAICDVKPLEPADVTNTTLILPRASARIRHDWTYNPPLSLFARAIEDHQSNCTRQVMTYHLDNLFGIGAHLALWSQAICNAMEQGYRIRMYNPVWLWLDQTFCNKEVAAKSPFLCYFPRSEYRCGCNEVPTSLNVSDPRDTVHTSCNLLKTKKGEDDVLHEFRAASTEYLFQQISPLVLDEAKRQIGLLFGPEGTPDDLVTVHIRWGDKFWEMPNRTLVAIQTYIDAISTLLHQQFGHNQTANIYLATEDPRAFQEFNNATPSGWNVFYDRTVEELSRFRPSRGNRASRAAKNSKGRAGLASFASMLVALEAKLFVLTTRSNWSRVINHLRTNIIDPRCNKCTKMVDLVEGVW
jgi:hypothetical protein